MLQTDIDATGADLGPFGDTVGGGVICLWVAAENADGESAWVQLPGDFSSSR